jgi:hypothetical protein
MEQVSATKSELTRSKPEFVTRHHVAAHGEGRP